MTYDKDYLISELKRFYNENDRVPVQLDMQPKFGYPSFMTYVNHFKTWNNALEAVGLEVNQYQDHWQDGTETCSYCGRRASEIPGHRAWYYHDDKPYCQKHGFSATRGLPDYVTGNLDINSAKGLGRVGEILVVKTLGIGNEYDCNRISCGYSFDMYHKEYGKIDVKTGLFSYEYNKWHFGFDPEKSPDTYICIGLSSDRSNVKHVWVLPNVDKIINKSSLQIYNTFSSLYDNKHWEVDTKTYNEMWQEMRKNYRDKKCKIFR